MAVNTWDGSTDTDWDTAANWTTTGVTDRVPTDADDVIIPDTSALNNPTLGANGNVKSLTIQANGTVVGGGYDIIVHGEGDGSGGTDLYAVKNDGIISGNLDLDIRTAAATRYDLAGTSGTFRNVTINHSSHAATLYTNLVISGDLTITAGSLDTRSGSNNAITVGGTTTLA